MRTTDFVAARDHHTETAIPDGQRYTYIGTCLTCGWDGPPRTAIGQAEQDGYEHTEKARTALPAEFHQPIWDDLGLPHHWHCAACWGDGWTTAWPCWTAQKNGRAVAEAGYMQVIR